MNSPLILERLLPTIPIAIGSSISLRFVTTCPIPKSNCHLPAVGSPHADVTSTSRWMVLLCYPRCTGGCSCIIRGLRRRRVYIYMIIHLYRPKARHGISRCGSCVTMYKQTVFHPFSYPISLILPAPILSIQYLPPKATLLKTCLT